MIPVTVNDVKKPLERELTGDEQNALVGRNEKASDLVEGYIGITYDLTAVPPDVIPGVVTRVVARMVARSFAASVAKADKTFTDSVTQNMGTFGATQRFNPDASSGDGPWLSKADKTALKPVYSGMRSTEVRQWDC